MNQLDIYCFTSIARTKSFSITARELMISQQAVSNHIKTLEEEVGYTLFFRYGQTAYLTKAGELMLDYFIHRDQMAADFFKAHKKEDSDQPFLIAWTQWAGCMKTLEKLLLKFRKKYPEDKFLVADMPAAKMKEALGEKKVDVLFTSQYAAEYMSTSWDHTLIGSQEILLVRSRRIEYTENALEKYPFYTIPAGESNEHAMIKRAKATCSRMGFVPRNVHICGDMGSAFLNVITNDGLSFGAEQTYELPSDNFILSHTGIYSDYIMCTPYFPVKPAVKKFKTFIKEEVRTFSHRSIKEAGQ